MANDARYCLAVDKLGSLRKAQHKRRHLSSKGCWPAICTCPTQIPFFACHITFLRSAPGLLPNLVASSSAFNQLRSTQ
jgi:hypothetical protein